MNVSHSIASRLRSFGLGAAAAAIAATALVTQISASAAPGPMAGRPLMEAMQELDLSDEQSKALRSIFKTHRSQIKAERAQAGQGRRAFAELDPDSPRHAAQVEELASKAADRTRARIPELAKLHSEVRAVLTETQRQQVIEKLRSVDVERLGQGHSGPMLAMFEDLELSDEQWLSLRAIRAQKQAEGVDERLAMQARLTRFVSLDPASATYASEIAALTDEFAEAAKRHVQTFAAVQAEVYAVLTPSQRSELIANMDSFEPREHFRKMRESKS